MARRLHRPPRWSKKTDELVRYVAQLCRPSLQSELGNWLEDNSQFRSFVAENQDKVRKKLNTSDEQARLDVRSELRVAYLVLRDRRFQVKFEAYGAGQRGPDLSATFRENQRFNLEVTRLRATEDADSMVRLAHVIYGKLRQLPGETPNGLVIIERGLSLTEETLAAAIRVLKQRLATEPGLHGQYLYLGGVFVLDEATLPASTVFAANREARHPLPAEVVAGLTAAFVTN